MNVLVTGASRGIGKAISHSLIEQGVRVIGTTTNLSNTFDNPFMSWLEVDFNLDDSFDTFIEDVKKFNSLDGIVNNAGINVIKPMALIDDKDVEAVFNVNLLKPFKICSRLSSHLSNGGKIVNIASIWSVISKENRTLYTSAKSGLAGMTRAMAVELGTRNILVNTVSPGFVLTDLTTQSLTKEEILEMSSRIPLERMANPTEIAELVTFLLGPKNTYLTGQNIVIDGGYTIV
jgi:3-oxoacyl-[acyl-carrier protein] reductase